MTMGKTGDDFYPSSREAMPFSSGGASSGNALGIGDIGVKISGRFDATKFCEKMRKWEQNILKRVGGYTRTTMMRSMDTGKTRPDKRFIAKEMNKKELAKVPQVRVHSLPGKPPKAWKNKKSDKWIKNKTRFFVNNKRAEVKIGPASENKSGNVLEVLEFGGRVPLPQGGQAYIAPRPYAAPAEKVGKKFLAKLLRESKPVF